MRKITMLSLIICLLVSIVLAGCSRNSTQPEPGSSPQQPGGQEPAAESKGDSEGAVSYGGVLKMIGSLDANALGYTPQLLRAEDIMYSGPALETLLRITPNGVVPWLAEHFEADPDNLTIDLTLHKGVKFHDGTDLDAEAVKWNFELFLSSPRAELNDITEVEIVDSHQLRLHLGRWNNSILEAISLFLFIISPTSTEANGTDWAMQNPVGTGPFKFVGWEKDVSIKYEKFDQYWQEGKPYLDGIEIHIISDPMTAAATFQTGDAHIFFNMSTEVAKMMKDAGIDVKMNTTGLGGQLKGLITNSVNPDSPFADDRVRKAVSYAIDSQAIVNSILYGFANVTNQWGAPGAWSHNPDIGISYNPEKAKQLLAEAGYPNGFSTTITTSNEAEAMSVMTAVQGFLKEIGIEAEINALDRGAFGEYSQGGKQWDGIIYWSGRADPDIGMYMGRNFGSKGTLYAHGIIDSDKIDELLAGVVTAKDPNTRVQMAHEAQYEVFENLALATAIYTTTFPAAIDDNVVGTGINETQPVFWTPQDAHFAK